MTCHTCRHRRTRTAEGCAALWRPGWEPIQAWIDRVRWTDAGAVGFLLPVADAEPCPGYEVRR